MANRTGSRKTKPLPPGWWKAGGLPIPPQFQVLLVLFLGWLSRQQEDVIDYLVTENQVLREQRDQALGGRRARFTDAQRRRLAIRGKVLGRKALRSVCGVVTPDTILRWYRRLVAMKYDGSAKRRSKSTPEAKPAEPGRPGRPGVSAEIAELVVRLATEVPTAGYTAIRDRLRGLKHEVSRSSVKRILDERGIEPAPERKRRTRWVDFLESQFSGVAATDFFSVEVLTWRGLVRYQVLFVMDLATRRVYVPVIAPEGLLSDWWMRRVAYELTDFMDGFLLGKKFLIMDRDPLFGSEFRDALRAEGVRALRLPARSPNLNAFAERWVHSIKSECLSRVIPLGQAHLRLLIQEYVAHYNTERFHQGLGGRLIDPSELATRKSGDVVCKKRLGGLLRYYHRAAA